jgi:hypothetical protein
VGWWRLDPPPPITCTATWMMLTRLTAAVVVSLAAARLLFGSDATPDGCSSRCSTPPSSARTAASNSSHSTAVRRGACACVCVCDRLWCVMLVLMASQSVNATRHGRQPHTTHLWPQSPPWPPGRS